MHLKNSKKIVIKIGSSLLIDKSKKIRLKWLTEFSKDVKEQRFYFVHSYAVQCNRPEDILTTTKYGYEFVSGFEKDNISGFQFHPEKSHKYGMQLFKNFLGKKNA